MTNYLPSKVWLNRVWYIFLAAVHLNFADFDFDVRIRLQDVTKRM